VLFPFISTVLKAVLPLTYPALTGIVLVDLAVSSVTNKRQQPYPRVLLEQIHFFRFPFNLETMVTYGSHPYNECEAYLKQGPALNVAEFAAWFGAHNDGE
jgi:hypothetical protein